MTDYITEMSVTNTSVTWRVLTRDAIGALRILASGSGVSVFAAHDEIAIAIINDSSERAKEKPTASAGAKDVC